MKFVAASAIPLLLATSSVAQERHLSVGDVDGDGVEELLVVSSEGVQLLARGSVGDLGDVTALAGLDVLAGGRFASWGDLDDDGDADLCVATDAHGVTLLENREGVFVDVSVLAGLPRSGAVLEGSWLDYDRDGLPDLHLRTATQELVFHNAGGGRFDAVPLDPGPLAMLAVPEEVEGPATADPGSTTGTDAPASRLLSHARPETSVTFGPGPEPASGVGGSAETDPAAKQIAQYCATEVEDASGGSCLLADSVPTEGRLFPLSEELFVEAGSGFVGMGTTSPTARLDVLDPSGAGLAAVRGEGAEGPTRGYLGAKGSAAFDGVGTASWGGLDLGVAGISTGPEPLGNVGVMGHASAAGVRGEFSADPSGTWGELGTLGGVGLRAAGPSLAAELTGGVDVVDGDVRLLDGAMPTIVLDVSEGGTGSQLTLSNGSGVGTIGLDADAGGTGNAIASLSDATGGNTAVLETSAAHGGAGAELQNWRITLGDDAGTTTMQLDGDYQGGQLDMFNDTGDPTVEMDGQEGSITLFSEDALGGVVLGTLERFKFFDAGEERVLVEGNRMYLSSAAHADAAFLDPYTLTNESSIRLGGQSSSSIVVESGTAGQFLGGGSLAMRDSGDTETVRIQSAFSQGGQAFFHEDDGSSACGLSSSMTLMDASGTITIVYNGSAGTKSAVVNTPSYGQRLFYGTESPGVWFEDFGSGRLSEGKALVRLDPVFLEAVTIDDAHPLQVLVTANGESGELWVEKRPDSFVVQERGGRSDVRFDWRVAAKRRGLADRRADPYVQERVTEDPARPGSRMTPNSLDR